VTLELGGNAAVVVRGRRRRRTTRPSGRLGRHANAGQTCISVQRVLPPRLARRVRGRPRPPLRGARRRRPARRGDGRRPADQPGDADRVEQWLQEAVDGGARILTGRRARRQPLPADRVTGVDDR
jgi:acyl-CoA reductase-like NAD-dependent aldehyde dehydrogenase